jgi:HEAT repeat protein
MTNRDGSERATESHIASNVGRARARETKESEAHGNRRDHAPDQECQSEDPEKLIAAIQALGDVEAFEAAPAVIQVLSSDPNWKVRFSAIFALNELEAVEALPLLI